MCVSSMIRSAPYLQGQLAQAVVEAGLGQDHAGVGHHRFGQDRGDVALGQRGLDRGQVVELDSRRRSAVRSLHLAEQTGAR